ncbi:MAG TPA: SLC13 family permease [Acidobacteriota bacterium]|nr:SLC13 family permease [Acidobacteriota bacterium]
MTVDMMILAAIITAAMVLFAMDVFPADKVSLMTLGALLLTDQISPTDAVSGFGAKATVTVACMLALSLGIERTGGLNYFANRIVQLAGDSELKVMIAIMIAVGILSAFINNTAAVALFLPITISVARKQGFQISKLLMPMSFAAIIAGTCTLIGTSTNLIVADEVQKYSESGLQIGMFDPTIMGLVFFAAGSLYLVFIGVRLIPSRRSGESLTADYSLRHFVTDLRVRENSPMIGKTIPEARLGERYNVDVVEILRGPKRLLTMGPLNIEPGDQLLVSGAPQSLLTIQREQGLEMKALKLQDQDLTDDDIVLVEAWISPNSALIESTLKESNFRQTYKATALAIRSHGKMVRQKIGTYRLEYGDSLLVLTDKDHLESLRRSPDFLVLEEVDSEIVVQSKIYWAMGIFGAMVLAAATGALDILEAALLAVAAMVFTKVVRLHELYTNISWQTIIMLGCLIPLGIAMENSGLAGYLGEQLVNTLRAWGPEAVLSGVYLVTSLLTAIMSNNATAVLMVPICLSVAQQLGVRPEPFFFAVMFAASACFMTPVGYQTNLFIFGPGGYKFADFLIVGTPLNILFWLLATFAIPYFWPF